MCIRDRYTVRLFSLSLVNMPITTWGMNALSNDLVNHGTSVNNTFRQVAGSLGTAIIVSASTIATNASAPAMGEQAASFFGIDVAFAVAGVLCLIGFVMVVALVKNRPGESAAKDPDNARRTVLESIMKRDVFTLPSNATVAEAMKLLVEMCIRDRASARWWPLRRCMRWARRCSPLTSPRPHSMWPPCAPLRTSFVA